jgi:DNA ligase (NAD+)
MSFQWAGETAVTTIEDLVWATSRLGIVTPVAVVQPVFLSGASITNVTLHNAAHVKAYNLKKGDRIEIIRSGEVIPKFLQVVEAAAGAYAWPQACDSCGTALSFDDVRLKCPNTKDCPAQQLGGILNWIRAAGIDDLSDKRLVPLMEAGLVKSIPDLYKLKEKDFFVIPQTKEKMAAKLFANIQSSRTLPLVSFLNGLGIEGAGATTWEKLLDRFHGLDALRAATKEEIADVHGFAETSAVQIAEGLAARKKLIDALLKVGVTPAFTAAVHDDGTLPLSGKTIVITGSLSRPRSEVEKAIKAAGGKTAGAVSGTTFAVVTDDPTSNSSKMKKARELGVLTWSEDDLWKALEA